MITKFHHPEYIKQHLEINDRYLQQVNYDDIPSLERMNDIRITVYRLQKCNNSDRYEIDLIGRGNKKRTSGMESQLDIGFRFRLKF